MTRCLWLLDPEGFPLERIDTLTGEHVPVLTGEMVPPGDNGRPVACSIPKVSGAVLGRRGLLGMRKDQEGTEPT